MKTGSGVRGQFKIDERYPNTNLSLDESYGAAGKKIVEIINSLLHLGAA